MQRSVAVRVGSIDINTELDQTLNDPRLGSLGIGNWNQGAVEEVPTLNLGDLPWVKPLRDKGIECFEVALEDRPHDLPAHLHSGAVDTRCVDHQGERIDSFTRWIERGRRWVDGDPVRRGVHHA